MKSYIGTKRILARPMNLADYNEYRGWGLPSGENGSDAGFLVEHTDGGEANHSSHKGPVAWLPAPIFEKVFRAGDMSFGLAIEALITGAKVARAGWNGKGIYLILIDDAIGVKRVGFNGEDCDIRLNQHIAIDTTGLQTDNTSAPRVVVPWIASQTDMLADDWGVVA